MTPQVLTADLCEEVLAAVRKSKSLGKSQRQENLLAYLLQESLSGDSQNVKEYSIAVDVFNRSESFKSSVDSIVRVEMHRLRKNIIAFNNSQNIFKVILEPRSYEIRLETLVNTHKEETNYNIKILDPSCGSGIFLVPSSIAKTLPSPSFILIAWFIGGIFTLTGALTYAELGAKFPKTGGVYVFLREAFGDLTAFLYGWSILTVVTSGAIAALGLGFAVYFNKIIGLGVDWNVIVAISAIVFLTIINIVGVKVGEIVSSTLTTLKLFGIGIVVFIGVFLYQNVPEINWELAAITTGKASSKSLFSSFAVAMIGIL